MLDFPVADLFDADYFLREHLPHAPVIVPNPTLETLLVKLTSLRVFCGHNVDLVILGAITETFIVPEVIDVATKLANFTSGWISIRVGIELTRHFQSSM
jgi:hypothetical protein